VEHREIVPCGPFDLAAARDFASGFPAGIGGGGASGLTLVMAFPVEPANGGSDGWRHSAVLELSQDAPDDPLRVRLDTAGDGDAALAQATRSLSLDHDGREWPLVGQRDRVIGQLQVAHRFLRPVCFYSAYEAVTSFVIGQRFSRRQAAVIKARLAALLGDHLALDGRAYDAFPRPERLLELDDVPWLPAERVRRLRGLAQAALDGHLDTARLRDLPRGEALARLRSLHGVGDFTAEGVYLRGCGVLDELPTDALSSEVLAESFAAELATGLTPQAITDRWRPYRMWATVLLRVGWDRKGGGRRSYRRDQGAKLRRGT